MAAILLYISMLLIGFGIAAVIFAEVLSRSNYIPEREDVVGRYAWVPEFKKSVVSDTMDKCRALEEEYCASSSVKRSVSDNFEKVHVIAREGVDVNVLKKENRHYTPADFKVHSQDPRERYFGAVHLSEPYYLDDELPPVEGEVDVPLFAPAKVREKKDEEVPEVMQEQYDFDEDLPNVDKPLFKPKD